MFNKLLKLVSQSLIFLTLATNLSGCFPGVYRIDIPQGNLIDPDKLEEVEVGMEPRQVRYLLGTPLLHDSFNHDRWDYYYSVTNGPQIIVNHHISIFFDNGRVTEIRNSLH